MSYEDRDQYGMYVDNGHKGPGPELMGADTLIGDHVHNLQNEHLGEIKEIMLDMRTGERLLCARRPHLDGRQAAGEHLGGDE